MKLAYKGVLTLLLALVVQFTFAQEKQISGTVSDNSGTPLPGVNIVKVGTRIGTETDFDGNYHIKGSLGDILEFSYMGMKTRRVTIANQQLINVVLEDDAASLDEIIVIGYGAQKKVNLTGAVSSINFEKNNMKSRALTNVSTALAGLSSGMFIVQNSGDPGADGASIKIRGTGSLSASQAPLILIDGVPGDMNAMNPQNIASVSVLKDAASAAIYGSRASNGVILITTKTGANTDGKVSFEYNSNVAFNKPTRLFDFVTSTPEHMELINQVQRNSGLTPDYSDAFINEWREAGNSDPLKYPNTDWWDVMIKENESKTHTISARGGTDKMSFFNSLGVFDNQGVIDNTGFKRYNFRNNLSYKVTDWLEIGNFLSAKISDYDPNNVKSVFTYFDGTTPGMVPKHPDGRYGAAQTQGGEAQANNPLYRLETAGGGKQKQEFDGKLFANITPIENLKIMGSYFLYHENYNSKSHRISEGRWDFMNEIMVMDPPNSIGIGEYNRRKKREVFDLNATYSKEIEAHSFTILAGYNQEYYKQEWFGASKKDLISNDIPVLDAAPNVPQAYGSAYDFALRSYFGRINYNYLEKYLVEANFRIDGSSRFNENKRWGTFPSFSIGWRISEEDFFEKWKATVSSLKLRASWGRLGNNNIKYGSAGQYVYQSVYKPTSYGFGEQITTGLVTTAIANSNLTWEETSVLNIGVDFNLFSKLHFTLDYYDKYTDGILASLPIPFVNGGLKAPFVNSAAVRNTGFEANLDYATQIGELSISANLNGSFNKNEIDTYKGDLLESHGVGVWTEGEPIGKYWLLEVDHIIQDQTEIDKLVEEGYTWNGPTPGLGDFLYKDTDGNKIFNNDDKTLQGNPIPKFTFGGSVSLAYKGLDFYMLFNGVTGWDKYLKSNTFRNKKRTDGYLFLQEDKGMWTEENRSTTRPKIYSNDGRNNKTSNYFLHDASYLRIKTLQLGYTLPKKFTEEFNIEQLRFYINTENYFTITNNYPGLDPENNSLSTYPLIKSFSLGMNVKI